MKFLAQELKTATASQGLQFKGSDPSEAINQMPDYSEMMVEVRKIGNPLILDELKSFYNIK